MYTAFWAGQSDDRENPIQTNRDLAWLHFPALWTDSALSASRPDWLIRLYRLYAFVCQHWFGFGDDKEMHFEN